MLTCTDTQTDQSSDAGKKVQIDKGIRRPCSTASGASVQKHMRLVFLVPLWQTCSLTSAGASAATAAAKVSTSRPSCMQILTYSGLLTRQQNCWNNDIYEI